MGALGFYPPSPRSRECGPTRAKQGRDPCMALRLLTQRRDDKWAPRGSGGTVSSTRVKADDLVPRRSGSAEANTRARKLT
jgi:hypothetical protein